MSVFAKYIAVPLIIAAVLLTCLVAVSDHRATPREACRVGDLSDLPRCR
jgi:hypothetical protein